MIEQWLMSMASLSVDDQHQTKRHLVQRVGHITKQPCFSSFLDHKDTTTKPNQNRAKRLSRSRLVPV